MDGTPQRSIGLPLFAVGALVLIAGLGFSSYWPMALGLGLMAYGALRWSESW